MNVYNQVRNYAFCGVLLAVKDVLAATKTMSRRGLHGKVKAPTVVACKIFVAAWIRTVEDGQRDLVDPAVKGTKNVLGAVAKSLDTVKRVVLTSSFAGVQRMCACTLLCLALLSNRKMWRCHQLMAEKGARILSGCGTCLV